ncbi:MAG: signal peptidase I [Clostridiales bacterium]|nr:signal peptidase I [Clostridiales bacterium]
MAPLRTKGLSFRRRKKKFSLSMSKNIALMAIKILIALFLAFVVVYSVGMKVTVSGNSMESIISDGDRVLVNRLVYSLSEPKAGDIIVFLPNGNEKSHYYVKRVVAVPGDTVYISDGVLYVNGEMYDDEDTEAIVNAGLAEEEITIGEDEYFVLGDNRNSSEDSRYANIGNIKMEYIVGKAWFYYSSIRDMGRVQ